jgi:hypothetical protein
MHREHEHTEQASCFLCRNTEKASKSTEKHCPPYQCHDHQDAPGQKVSDLRWEKRSPQMRQLYYQRYIK